MALAKITETPEALSVMTILGVIATLCTQRVIASPKEGWQEPVNLYTFIALPSANYKSWALRQCIRPLIDWEKQQHAALEGDIKRQRSERKTQDTVLQYRCLSKKHLC